MFAHFKREQPREDFRAAVNPNRTVAPELFRLAVPLIYWPLVAAPQYRAREQQMGGALKRQALCTCSEATFLMVCVYFYMGIQNSPKAQHEGKWSLGLTCSSENIRKETAPPPTLRK